MSVKYEVWWVPTAKGKKAFGCKERRIGTFDNKEDAEKYMKWEIRERREKKKKNKK